MGRLHPALEPVVAVVVTWNSEGDIAACLEALAKQTHRNFRILVMDNGSHDDSVAAARAVAARSVVPIDVRANPTNVGFAGACNDAFSEAKRQGAAMLWLVNPDALPAPTYLESCVARMLASPRAGSVQGVLMRQDGTVDSAGHELLDIMVFRNIRTAPLAATRVFGVTGAAALHRMRMLEDLASDHDDALPFDTALNAYFDDVDLDIRARLRCWTAWVEPQATATHRRSGNAWRPHPLVGQLSFANHLRVLIKCMPQETLQGRRMTLALVTGVRWARLAISRPGSAVPALRQLRTLRRDKERGWIVRRGANRARVESWIVEHGLRRWFADIVRATGRRVRPTKVIDLRDQAAAAANRVDLSDTTISERVQ